MKIKHFFIFLLIVSAFFLGSRGNSSDSPHVPVISDEARIKEAFEKGTSDIWVELGGTIEKVLPDDREGAAHQRLIVQLSTGQTILLSHNIDIAPRVADPQVGSEIYFRGEYEWNSKGGVVHWTHHDPNSRRSGGWIEYKGVRYQ